ncbi:MAG: hypothetical protein HYY64_07240 [Candidatus Rokubacteria bacterium]|nr:hypothetical protein [Candidatus Rokubacteria bacterium]
MPSFGRAVGALFLGVFLGGCALFTIDQRATEGPTAQDVWKERFKMDNGRGPSFSETQGFEDQMDAQVQEFLRKNPDVANSYRVSNLRLVRQVMVGMTKGEVTLLLGKPQDMTDDAARMEALARRWWPAVKPNAKEAWVYPGGWTLYFDGNAVTDI